MNRHQNMATQVDIEKVAAYLLRTIASEGNQSHNFLVDLIIKFYFTADVQHLPFEWNKNKQFTFSNQRRRFVKRSNGWSTLRTKDPFKTDSTTYLRWELTLKERKYGKPLEFLMGCIPDKRSTIQRGDVLWGENIDLKNELAFWVKDGVYPKVCNNGDYKTFYGNTSITAKKGDTFRLDFEAGECRIYHNDKIVGLLTRKLPDFMFFAISVNSHGVSFAVSMFAETREKSQQRRRGMFLDSASNELTDLFSTFQT